MALPRGAMGCLWFVMVALCDHTHLLLFMNNKTGESKTGNAL